MKKLRKLIDNGARFLRLWRLEVWMAAAFATLFFTATQMGQANPRIGWIAFLLYTVLVAIHHWVKTGKDREIRSLHADIQKNIQRLKELLGRAHDMHRALIRQREEVAKVSEQVEQSRQELLAMSDLKNKFIATLSHELRTPLASIQECLNLITEGIAGPTNPKQREFLEIARRNAERLRLMLDDLLDLSRLQAGGIRMVLAKTPLEEMVLESINTLKPKAQRKGVRLSMDGKWHLPAVLADRTHVVQVLNNLLDNAIKFTHGGGEVGVSARWDETAGRIEVCVWDKGAGISKERVEHMFEGVNPLDRKEDYTSSGVGFGLAICKEIVTQLGGSIWAESEVGTGSRFYFTLLQYSDETLLAACFWNAHKEAVLKNSSLYYLGIQVAQHEALMDRYGARILKEPFEEVRQIVASSFRQEDRVAVEIPSGRIHVLIVSAGDDMNKRIRKLNEQLCAKTFFVGNDVVKIRFLYGLAQCPQDGEDLGALRTKIDSQIRDGGLDIAA